MEKFPPGPMAKYSKLIDDVARHNADSREYREARASLDAHIAETQIASAKALADAQIASAEKVGSALTRATYALVFVTAVLVAVTIVLVVVTASA